MEENELNSALSLLNDNEKDHRLDVNNVKDRAVCVNLVLAMYKMINASNPQQALKEATEDGITKLTEVKKKLQSKLDKMRLLDLRVHQLIPPKNGTKKNVSIEHLRLTCSIFDPSFSSEDDLVSTIRKLGNYAESNDFDHSAVKFCLSNLLQGEAFTVYYCNREKDLKNIYEIIENSFCSYKTVLDYDKCLKNAKRQKGQSLGNFMNEITRLWHKTLPMRADTEERRSVEQECILLDKLCSAVSPTTLNILQSKIKDALKSGITLDFKRQFEICRDIETNAGENPVPPKMSLMHSSFQPEASDDEEYEYSEYSDDEASAEINQVQLADDSYSDISDEENAIITENWHRCSEDDDESGEDQHSSGLHSTTFSIMEETGAAKISE